MRQAFCSHRLCHAAAERTSMACATMDTKPQSLFSDNVIQASGPSSPAMNYSDGDVKMVWHALRWTTSP